MESCGQGTESLFMKYIDPADIDVPEVKLRGVRENDPDFQDLLLSIQRHGVLEPILVRPLPNGRFSLVNGLQRLTCAKRCEHDVIPARIDENITDDTDALLKSILTNLHIVKTRPFEYANSLRLYIRRDPEMTIKKLADLLGKSTSWVVERLSLTNLGPGIGAKVDNGDISLTKAQGLALFPISEQEAVLQEAGDLSSPEFHTFCVERDRAKQTLRHKDDQEAPPFVAKPLFRKRQDIQQEAKLCVYGREFLEDAGEMSPTEIWRAAVAWTIQMDSMSLEERQKAHEERHRNVMKSIRKENENE